MKRAPFVTVVIPVYKTRMTIAESIDSVLSQSFDDYEIIVVDDGSPDDVADFVEKTYGDKVTLIRQKNQGLAGARNTGLSHAKGTYVAFLDSDDVWLPNKLERQITAIKHHPEVDVHYSNCYFWRNGSREGQWLDLHQQADGVIIRQLIQRTVMIPVLTALIKTATIRAAGGFDASLRQVEDYDLWLRLGLADAVYMADPEPTALYRINPEGLSQNRLLMAETQLAVYSKQTVLDDELRQALTKQISIFRLEVIHQKRLLALARHQYISASLLTLKMIPMRPQRAIQLFATALLLIIMPGSMGRRLQG